MAEKPSPVPQTNRHVYQPLSRRSFLRGAAASAAAMAALAAALKPLLALEKGELTLDALLQKHYRRMSPEEIATVLQRLEQECQRAHGVAAQIRDLRPLPRVQFACALNLTRCVGCRRCAHACLSENNQSRESETDLNMSYIRVLELDKGEMNLETSNQYYNPETVPQKDKYYMPVQCHQCRQPPCTKVCPVQATWQEPDGIIAIDYNWCIGCRYCMAACPYDARRFNFNKPRIHPAAINRNQDYLSNRIRPKGVVEKCTFCLQRTREGRYPACLEVCPTGARVFGNLLDPDSEINYILKNKRVYILKEEVSTRPKFYYFFDP